jgi:hypothetical protein
MRGTGTVVVVVSLLVLAGPATAAPGAAVRQDSPGSGQASTIQPDAGDDGDRPTNVTDAGVTAGLRPVVEVAGAGAGAEPGRYGEAARAGAGAALETLAARGVAVDERTRSAALQGAVEGAALVAEGGSDAPPSAGTVRSAARGAVLGALLPADGESVPPETVRQAVGGALAGASLATALGTGQGGTDDRLSVFGAAYGGAEGAVATVTGLAGEQRAALAPEQVQLAALGGAGGAAGAASLLPIFGDRVEATQTRGAAFGGAAGALRGTAEQLAVTGRVTAGQTFGASLGASAGALSATLQQPGLTGTRLSGTAYGVGRETVRRADELTQEQMLETALTASVDRLVGEAGGDSVFPSAIVLPRYNLAIGPPRDPDADGAYEDVNGNRVLTYADVVSLSIVRRLYAEGLVPLSATQRRALDFNGDGVFDARDIRALDGEITAITDEGQ